jgi:hypothetical protein
METGGRLFECDRCGIKKFIPYPDIKKGHYGFHSVTVEMTQIHLCEDCFMALQDEFMMECKSEYNPCKDCVHHNKSSDSDYCEDCSYHYSEHYKKKED